MRTLILTSLVLVALAATPLASAAFFAGSQKLTLEHSDSGSIAGTSVLQDGPDYRRTFELRIDWTRVGVYDMERVSGVDAFFGQGREHTGASGSLKVHLDDQGVTSDLTCALDVSEEHDSTAAMLSYEGEMVVLAGRGLLDADAWQCQDAGNEVYLGGAEDIPLSSYAFAGVEGVDKGTFPADLAVLLGWADDEGDWGQDRWEEGPTVLRSGYVEAAATSGKQTIPFARTLGTSDAHTYMARMICGSISSDIEEEPISSMSCTVDGDVTLEIGSGSGSAGAGSGAGSPTATPAGGAGTGAGAEDGSAGGSDTPAPAVLGVLAAMGVAALSLRRRA